MFTYLKESLHSLRTTDLNTCNKKIIIIQDDRNNYTVYINCTKGNLPIQCN